MLADDITQALPELRAHAESRMLDSFLIGHYGDGWVYDDLLEQDVREFIVAFPTKGRVKVTVAMPQASEVGARTSYETRRELHIPTGSPATPDNAVARCVAIHRTTDPTLLGAELSITGPAPGSQTTARRLTVTEVIS